jgi:membrane-bound serine protease (ClpP class)
MALVASPMLPNLLFIVLLAGVWLVALAMVTPGTGVLEVLAAATCALAGSGLLVLPFNTWSLVPLILGVGFLGLAVWRRASAVWLALAAVSLSLGSVFLFKRPGGGPSVSPALAIAGSLLTLGFFWLSIRKSLAAQQAAPRLHPLSVTGAIGEARTDIDGSGSVYVAGELWSARSGSPISAGSKVKVVDRQGLILTVEAVNQDRKP